MMSKRRSLPKSASDLKPVPTSPVTGTVGPSSTVPTMPDCLARDAKHDPVNHLHLRTRAFMKKNVIIPAVLLTAVLSAGGLYFAHIQAVEKVSAARAAPPPPVPIVAGTV